MAKHWLWAGASLGLILQVSGTAGATEALAVAIEPVEQLAIPFAPPLDQDLRYDLVVTKSSSNKGRSSVRLEQKLRFVHTEGGYRLTITMLRVDVAGKDAIALAKMTGATPDFLRASFGPYDLNLDTNGAVLAMGDWLSLKAALTSSTADMSKLLEPDPAKQVVAREVANGVAAQFSGLSAEDAPYLLVKGWPSVLGYAGVEGEAGKSYPINGELPPGLMPMPLPVQGTFTLSREGNGILHYAEKTEPDRKAFAAGMQSVLAGISASWPTEQQQKLRSAAAAFERTTMTDVTEMRLDARTGMVVSARIAREISGSPGEKASDTIEIRRIDLQ